MLTNHVNKLDVIWIHLKVAGRNPRMELDTVSAVSVISLCEYSKLYKHLRWRNTTAVLRTFTGEQIQPKGKLCVQVQDSKQSYVLDLYVVDTRAQPWLGRDCLRKIKLDRHTVKSIHVDSTISGSTDAQLKHLLNQYSEVFKDEIGTLRGTKARLSLKTNSKPVFHKAKPAPHALHPKIEHLMGNICVKFRLNLSCRSGEEDF